MPSARILDLALPDVGRRFAAEVAAMSRQHVEARHMNDATILGSSEPARKVFLYESPAGIPDAHMPLDNAYVSVRGGKMADFYNALIASQRLFDGTTAESDKVLKELLHGLSGHMSRNISDYSIAITTRRIVMEWALDL
jgi:hypothetical protein